MKFKINFTTVDGELLDVYFINTVEDLKGTNGTLLCGYMCDEIRTYLRDHPERLVSESLTTISPPVPLDWWADDDETDDDETDDDETVCYHGKVVGGVCIAPDGCGQHGVVEVDPDSPY